MLSRNRIVIAVDVVLQSIFFIWHNSPAWPWPAEVCEPTGHPAFNNIDTQPSDTDYHDLLIFTRYGLQAHIKEKFYH